MNTATQRALQLAPAQGSTPAPGAHSTQGERVYVTSTGVAIGSAWLPKPQCNPQAISGPHRRRPVHDFFQRRLEDALILLIATACGGFVVGVVLLL